MIRAGKFVWTMIFLTGTVVLVLFFWPGKPGQLEESHEAPTSEKFPVNSPIGCLGRIEPQDGVIKVAARSISGQPSIVGRLMVAEGDTVQPGQILAELDAKDQLESGYRLGQARVEVARRRLDQVKTGAKASEVEGQRAEIERIGIELENARKDLQRHRDLHQREVVAESLLDSRVTRVSSLERLLRQAKERLSSLSEIRQVDVDLARAELDAAVRETERARQELVACIIRSPAEGRVVKIHAWPGEEVGPLGLLELAKTRRMYAVAEVYETDVTRVRVGQRAKISADGLPGALHGTVESIGLKVLDNRLMPVSPASFSDSRIVEVKILLDEGESVAGLINLRVDVVIEP